MILTKTKNRKLKILLAAILSGTKIFTQPLSSIVNICDDNKKKNRFQLLIWTLTLKLQHLQVLQQNIVL
jgi:hypothetical protein